MEKEPRNVTSISNRGHLWRNKRHRLSSAQAQGKGKCNCETYRDDGEVHKIPVGSQHGIPYIQMKISISFELPQEEQLSKHSQPLSWLVDWWIGGLIGWSIGWSMGWLIDCQKNPATKINRRLITNTLLLNSVHITLFTCLSGHIINSTTSLPDERIPHWQGWRRWERTTTVLGEYLNWSVVHYRTAECQE